MNMDVVFSNSSIFILILSSLACVAGPVFLLFHYKKKYDAKTSGFFLGMAGFFVFGFFLCGLLINILFYLLPSVSAIPWQSAFYDALITSLTCGFGRYVMMKYCMKNQLSAGSSMIYGAGQGGLYAMIFGTTYCITTAVTMLFNNTLGTTSYLTKLGMQGETLESGRKDISKLIEIGTLQHLFDGTAPLFLFLTEVALSVFMFIFITNKTAKFLFPISFILQFIVLLSYRFEKKNIITNPLTALFVIMIITAFCGFYKLRAAAKESP